MFFPWSRYSGRYAPSTRRWMTAGTQSWRSWSWPLRRQRTYSGSSPRQWCPPPSPKSSPSQSLWQFEYSPLSSCTWRSPADFLVPASYLLRTLSKPWFRVWSLLFSPAACFSLAQRTCLRRVRTSSSVFLSSAFHSSLCLSCSSALSSWKSRPITESVGELSSHTSVEEEDIGSDIVVAELFYIWNTCQDIKIK